MLKRSISLLAVMAMASVANAGAVAELRLADMSGNPITQPAGGFAPGDQFLVELWVQPTQDVTLREMVVDYRGSDAAIIPSFGTDIDSVNQPVDGINNFWFDYTGASPFSTYPADGLAEPFPGFFVPTTSSYTDFSNLTDTSGVAAPVQTATSITSDDGNLKTLTGGVFNRIGGMPITAPSINGTFNVDLLGSPDGMVDNRNNGSSFTFGFGADASDPVTIYAAATGDSSVNGALSYDTGAGPLGITVVPEPATLILLGLGGLVALRRKRKA